MICKHHRPAASNEIQTEPVVLNKAYLCETYFYYKHWHDNKEMAISKVILSFGDGGRINDGRSYIICFSNENTKVGLTEL